MTTRTKTKKKNTLFARVISIFLALLIVGSSPAALIVLFCLNDLATRACR